MISCYFIIVFVKQSLPLTNIIVQSICLIAVMFVTDNFLHQKLLFSELIGFIKVILSQNDGIVLGFRKLTKLKQI